MSKNTNLSFLTDYITADITNGRIGINNASPTVAFDVVGATKITGVLTLTSTISNGTYAYTLPSATGTLALTSALSGTTNYLAKFTGTSTIGNSLIYDNGTNVGIGTTFPACLLHVKGSSNYDGQIIISNGTTTGGGVLYIHQNNVSSGFFSTRGSALGNTSRDLTFYAAGGLGIYTYTNEGVLGPYVASGGTSWTSSSDIRLKNIISPIDNAVDKLTTLNPVIFSWKSDEENKENIGLIAQDVKEVFPQVIDTNEDGFLGVRYLELVPVLVKAIQEQQVQIEELKTLLKA